MSTGGNYKSDKLEIDSIFFEDLKIIIENNFKVLEFINDINEKVKIKNEDQKLVFIPSLTTRNVEKILFAEDNFNYLYAIFSHQYNGNFSLFF